MRRYGIGSFTFRSLRPFHPDRLRKVADAMQTREREDDPLTHVIRAKGVVWLASAHGHGQQVRARKSERAEERAEERASELSA